MGCFGIVYYISNSLTGSGLFDSRVKKGSGLRFMDGGLWGWINKWDGLGVSGLWFSFRIK